MCSSCWVYGRGLGGRVNTRPLTDDKRKILDELQQLMQHASPFLDEWEMDSHVAGAVAAHHRPFENERNRPLYRSVPGIQRYQDGEDNLVT